MLESGGGSIINMSSVAGVVAQPGQVAYITTKHGVIALTKAAAVEYSGRGIRVNALLPGTVKTPLVEKFIADNPGFLETLTAVPIPRPGEPAEIAEAVAWLASDASSFITGASMSIDGGFVAQEHLPASLLSANPRSGETREKFTVNKTSLDGKVAIVTGAATVCWPSGARINGPFPARLR